MSSDKRDKAGRRDSRPPKRVKDDRRGQSLILQSLNIDKYKNFFVFFTAEKLKR